MRAVRCAVRAVQSCRRCAATLPALLYYIRIYGLGSNFVRKQSSCAFRLRLLQKRSMPKRSRTKLGTASDKRSRGDSQDGTPIENGELPFSKTTVLISVTLAAAEKRRLTSLIRKAGGRVVKKVDATADFLVQSHNDEVTDERLEDCCDLGIVAVPPAYIDGCVQANRLIPFREWAQLPPAGTVGGHSIYLDPVQDPSLLCKEISRSTATISSIHKANPRRYLLGAVDCGNVDCRCRETEEINQTLITLTKVINKLIK